MPKGQYKYVKVIRPKNIGRFMREPQDRDIYVFCGPQQGGEQMDKNRIKGLKRSLSVLALCLLVLTVFSAGSYIF